MFQLVAPLTDALLARRFVVGQSALPSSTRCSLACQKSMMHSASGKFLRKKFSKPLPPSEKRNLLLGIIPANLRGLATQLRAQLVEAVKTR